ncbi:hypothetical protein AAFF_G00440060, partial [Aldrovandia affinis]
MSKEVRILLKDRNTAFRSGDRALYSAARANLKRGIRDAKAAYKRKIGDHFTNNDPRWVWQGIQHITNYKSSNRTAVNGELNCFFARFEVKAVVSDTTPPPASNSYILTVQEHD